MKVDLSERVRKISRDIVHRIESRFHIELEILEKAFIKNMTKTVFERNQNYAGQSYLDIKWKSSLVNNEVEYLYFLGYGITPDMHRMFDGEEGFIKKFKTIREEALMI